MAKTTIAGPLLVMLFLFSGSGLASVCTDENGNPVPCEQDPGGGGSGGDPCSISQKGWCEYQTIYPGGYECEAASCAADPAAPLNCAGFNTRTCEQGTGADGNPIYVWINDCTYCFD